MEQTIHLKQCRGRNLAEVLYEAGIPLRRSCGGRGKCGACEVVLRSGLVREGGAERAGPVRVRACQSLILSDELSVEKAGAADRISKIEESFENVRPWPGRGIGLFAGRRGGCALAFDIGTTTVAARLFEADTGALLSYAGALNAQTRVADDVVSRIGACTAPDGLQRLQRLVLETMNNLSEACLKKANRKTEDLSGIIVAGNTTMGHLFLGVDPTPMGRSPFAPRFTESRRVDGGTLCEQWAGIPVVTLPHVSAFIGSDISAGLWAADFFACGGIALFMDIGTNGEIVLKTPKGLFAASAAAGPAFEGYGLTSGMRAASGAISAISFAQGKIECHTIDDAPAQGICGSGYVDFLAEGLREGWLSRMGRYGSAASAVLLEGKGKCVKLTENEMRPVFVSEADVANLLKAKGAIAATLLTLLDKASLSAADIDHLFLAGGFGRHINAANAQACGLLPPVPLERIRYLGNASLGGACLCALDGQAISTLSDGLKNICTVEVNLEPTFEDHFIDEMALGPMGEPL